tara:strand:- start:685 stop:1857 length:1173 start_codon:yes stop_codon:yes gene_type:complete
MKYNYNRQHISPKDINSVISALKSERITQGKLVALFENKIKNYFGSKYSLVVSNATSAFYLLSQALKWKQRDHIILSPLTFVAAANSVLKCNATPVFVDTRLSDQNLDPDLVEKKIKELKKKKKKVVAVVVTDYAGKPSEWKKFKKIRSKYNLKLVNDNCHALGAKYHSTSKYAIKYADFVIQSYHAVKNITTAEGGSILTNDKKILDKLKILREHGFIKNNKKNPFNYNIKEVGFNFRLADLNCALGISQINRINLIRKQRDEMAKIYDKIFKNNKNIITPTRVKNKKSGYHLYNVRVKFDNLRLNKINFYKILKKKYNINLQVHYTPTYMFDIYKKFISRIDSFNNTEKYYNETFSLPLYIGLKKRDIILIANKILSLIVKYSKINTI